MDASIAKAGLPPKTCLWASQLSYNHVKSELDREGKTGKITSLSICILSKGKKKN